MENHERFLLAELFEVSPAEAQRQSIEQVHDQADHQRVAAQAQLDEIRNLSLGAGAYLFSEAGGLQSRWNCEMKNLDP